jgi:hypothetical protein
MTNSSYVEHDVLLMICDISGYTRFMVSNAEARFHSYAVVTELMQAVLRSIKSPLQVAKLEGDAVFFYAQWPGTKAGDEKLAARALSTMDALFGMFEDKRRELEESNICHCGACKNIDKLSIKGVIHCGKAAIHSIGKFCEITGVDVILAHRLMKNSLDMTTYVLMTESAKGRLNLDEEKAYRSCEEHYEEIGTVSLCVAVPPLAPVSVDHKAKVRFDSAYWKAVHILKRIFASRLMRLRLIRRRAYRNLPI